MRRNGYYAVYKGKEYSLTTKNSNICLWSRDIKSTKLGFKLASTEYQIKRYGASYSKIVPRSDIERIFCVDIVGVYKGIKCGILAGSTEHGYDIIIGNSSIRDLDTRGTLSLKTVLELGFESWDRSGHQKTRVGHHRLG